MMRTHDRHVWPRLLIALTFGLSLIPALLWLLGRRHFPVAQASLLLNPFASPLSTDPYANELDVSLDHNVTVTYNESISLTSVTSRTFAVYGSQSAIFTGTYSLSNLSRTVMLDPARNFFPGERLDATVTTATLTLTGEHPIRSIVWQWWATVDDGSGVFAPHPVSPTFGGGDSTAVALGDLDNDGDLDAIVANAGNQPQNVRLNDGTGRFLPHPVSPTLGAGNSTAVALGDVDGDGDLDAIIANDTGQAQDVYLNDGTGQLTPHPVAPTFGAGNSTAVALGDVDGDGDLDVVVANDTGQAQDVYLNDGTGQFTPHPSAPTFGAGDSTAVALGDVDRDGDLDAVVANASGQPQDVYLNDGTGQFTPHPSAPTFGAGNSTAVALADLDGDRDLDAVVANDGAAQEVYLNDGTGQFAPHPSIPTFGSGNSTAVVLADVDDDGGLDAVVANDTGQAQDVYLNDGSGRFTAHPIKSTFGAGNSTDLALGDIDGDGDLDIVVANDGGQVQTVWVNRDEVDLGVSKSATSGGPLEPGDPLTYTIVYSNAGPRTATNVVITDIVPITLTDLSFASSGAQITPTGSVSYTWLVEDLSPGEGGIITITGIVNPSSSALYILTNRVTITTTATLLADVNLENNESIVSNNVASFRVYLPLVMKSCHLYLPVILKGYAGP